MDISYVANGRKAKTILLAACLRISQFATNPRTWSTGMSNTFKEGAIGVIIFTIAFVFLIGGPMAASYAQKQSCIELGMKERYSATDIMLICGK